MDAHDQTTQQLIGTKADRQGNNFYSERQGLKSSNQQQPKRGSKRTNQYKPGATYTVTQPVDTIA